jgi:hypothetical protein
MKDFMNNTDAKTIPILRDFREAVRELGIPRIQKYYGFRFAATGDVVRGATGK